MPIIKSAKKKMRQDVKRRDRNKALKTYMKNLRKKTLDLLEKGSNQIEAAAMVKSYETELDKAWAKGIYKRNKSSRLKSRLSSLFTKKFSAEKK